MAFLRLLGTAASVPDAEHDTIGLLLHGQGWAVLIDCGGSPLYKLARVGVDQDDIEALVLTHRHADHVYGLPMLVQGLWLGGREHALPIYGPAEALHVARELLALFQLDERPDMFRLEWHEIPLREGWRVLEAGGVRIVATPVDHYQVDTVALRFENLNTGRAIVYSADTAPVPALVRLAAGADLLLHEASGGTPGHSSPAQAADVANQAGVGELGLIHYPVRDADLDAWLGEAVSVFGPTRLAQDGDSHEL
jgi:ribonuclease Z